MRCERYRSRLPSVRDAVQAGENPRKNSFLNYESPALTAELQTRIDRGLKHSISRRPTLEPWQVSQLKFRIARRGG